MKDPFERELAVFGTVRRLSEAERAAYLDMACAGDPALRQRVEQLLQAGEEAPDFLQAPAPGAQRPEGVPAASTLVVNLAAPGEKAGDRIGRYKLLQQIGEGGCGVVYMAEQEEPVRRRVALKVIKLGMDTKQVIARFEAERQALAMMDHANIAKVLDAGTTETGRPYFVMELVRGIKITDYCDESKLSTQERLKLFIQVCQAIQHAHQKGVIHRDIKPSNILVTINDGVPVPKVIDFGIAKATQGRLTDQTLFTAFEQFMGTPAYMSPEQAVMTSLDIDTRSDIYSLGVLLYELLTGSTPFDANELLQSGLDALRRTIREKEPLRPSTRLSAMAADALTTTAKRRHTDAPKLLHAVRGDLDWIVMKCLEKDRARRYETANGVAMDVKRHLNCEPVVARPPSRLYEFQKTVRRHKFGFAAAGAVAAALILGLGAATGEYLKERKARLAAETASGLLARLVGLADPDYREGSEYSYRRMLDEFASGLTSRNQFAGQPELEATVCSAMGWTYFRLGDLAKAEPNLRRAVALRRSMLGEQNADTLNAQHLLARFLIAQRKSDEAARLSRDTWQGRVRLLGAENPYTLASQEAYASALLEGGHLAEAEALQRQIIPISERVLGTNNFDTMCGIGVLGQILEVRGAHAEAEGYLRRSLEGLRRIGLADQQDALLCAKELAMSRLLQGFPADAERLLKEAHSLAVRALPPDHNVTLFLQRVLARALAEQSRFDEAERLCKQTLEGHRRAEGARESHGAARTRLYLGRVLVEQGKLDEAEPLLQAALKFFRNDPASTPKPELAAQAANWLGAIQLRRQAYPEAEALVLPDSDRFFVTNPEMSPNERRLAAGHILALYQAWGKPGQAAIWQKKLEALPPLPKVQ